MSNHLRDLWTTQLGLFFSNTSSEWGEQALNISLTTALQSWVITLYANWWKQSGIKGLAQVHAVLMVKVEKKRWLLLPPVPSLSRDSSLRSIGGTFSIRATAPSCWCAFTASALRGMWVVHRNNVCPQTGRRWLLAMSRFDLLSPSHLPWWQLHADKQSGSEPLTSLTSLHARDSLLSKIIYLLLRSLYRWSLWGQEAAANCNPEAKCMALKYTDTQQWQSDQKPKMSNTNLCVGEVIRHRSFIEWIPWNHLGETSCGNWCVGEKRGKPNVNTILSQNNRTLVFCLFKKKTWIYLVVQQQLQQQPVAPPHITQSPLDRFIGTERHHPCEGVTWPECEVHSGKDLLHSVFYITWHYRFKCTNWCTKKTRKMELFL